MALFDKLAAFEPQLRSLFRIVFALMFSFHGYQKFFGWFGALGGFQPPLNSMLGAAGVFETFGGALLLLGLGTRPVAFILSGQMAVAYFRTHAPGGWNPLLNGGELAVLFCFAFLWLSAAGGGPWSVDHLMGRKS